MGLDISVYTDAKPLEEQPVKDADGYWSDSVWDLDGAVYANGNNERSLRGLLPETWYSAKYSHGFRAGSYSGYNRFREDLCRAALGVEPREVWSSPAAYEEKPFYELINFSDCEGTIGPEAAADLYRDFEDQEAAVLAAAAAALEEQDLEWFAGLYAEWKNAFRVASEGHGLVEFH